MIIADEQKALLCEYGVKIHEDVNATLSELDAKITEIGFDADYELNRVGLKLQLVYDELYSQN